MHTPHILTQMLNQATGGKSLVMGADNNPGNFKQLLQKEVQNQSKPSSYAEVNKNKQAKLEKPNQAPPSQQNKAANEAPNTSNEAEKLDKQTTDNETDPVETDKTDETVVAFIDQLGQVNQITQAQIASEQRPATEPAKEIDTGTDVEAIGGVADSKAPRAKLNVSDGTENQSVALKSDTEPAESARDLAQVKNLIEQGRQSNPVTEHQEITSNDDATVEFIQSNGVNGVGKEIPAKSANDNSLIRAESPSNLPAQNELASLTQSNRLEDSKPIETNENLRTKSTADDQDNDQSNNISKSAKAREPLEFVANKLSIEKTTVNSGQTESRTKNFESTLESITATRVATNAPPSATDSLKLAELKQANSLNDHIAPRVGSKGWDQAIGQKVVWMVAGGDQSAELSLNPPDLGPVQVVLSISDNQVDASFISSHLEVREAIEAAAPRLREMMDNAGISLSGFSVSSQASQSSPQEQAPMAPNRVTRQASGKEDSASTAIISPTRQSRPKLGAVDTFV